MPEAESLTQVAENEAISVDIVADFDDAISHLFGEAPQARHPVETSTGMWEVFLSAEEPGLDMVVFEKVTPIRLPEIPAEHLLVNRVKVGIGLRTIRVITETGATVQSDDPAKNSDPDTRNKLNFLSFNTVTVDEGFEVNPQDFKYYPEPRSAESVARVLTAATELLSTIE